MVASECTKWYSYLMKFSVSAQVDASPRQIWELFMDVERWPRLTKSILDVKRSRAGALVVGEIVTIAQPRLPQSEWRVTHVELHQRFTWENVTRGVTSIGEHLIAPLFDASTITLSLEQTGRFLWLTDLLAGRLVKRYLSMELDGFRFGAEEAAARHRTSGVSAPCT